MYTGSIPVCLSKRLFDKRGRGRSSPATATPTQFPLKSCGFPGVETARKICCSGKWDFPTQKYPRTHRTCRWALPKPAGCEARRALRGFFDSLTGSIPVSLPAPMHCKYVLLRHSSSLYTDSAPAYQLKPLRWQCVCITFQTYAPALLSHHSSSLYIGIASVSQLNLYACNAFTPQFKPVNRALRPHHSSNLHADSAPAYHL
jgi:hypothetical protein